MPSATTKKAQSGAAALRDLAVSSVSTETILDVIDRLGVKDLLLSRVRSRIEDADYDALIDDALGYVRRNPEVLVILLGTATIAAGLIVFLESRRPEREEDDDYENVMEMPSRSASRSSSGSSGPSSTSGGSSSNTQSKSRPRTRSR